MTTTTHPASLMEPKVFTPGFLIRLSRLTNVERELRVMGYPVLWSRLAGLIPQAHIHLGEKAHITPLLNRAKPHSYRTYIDQDKKMAACEFEGVLVSWERP